MQFFVTYFPSFQQSMPRGPAFSLRDSSPEFKDSVVFSTLVDRALSLRDSSSDIKKFRLRCSCCSNDLALINAWIQTDIERNVVELDLRVDTILDDYRRFELPQCMFTCKTLVALKVSSNCKRSSCVRVFPQCQEILSQNWISWQWLHGKDFLFYVRIISVHFIILWCRNANFRIQFYWVTYAIWLILYYCLFWL